MIEANPHIDKIHIFNQYDSTIQNLSKEKFNFIVDLQNNWKSRLICWKLRIPNKAFPKLNIRKFLVVLSKIKSILSPVHIVDRYFKAAHPLGIKNDQQGLDFFINDSKISCFVKNYPIPYISVVTGGSYNTKKIPLSKLREIAHRLVDKKIVLLGDENDFSIAHQLASEFQNIENLCGKLNLHESAYMIKNSTFVITSDTGLMHIAAAFKKTIYSLWGNTIPEFGMYPYFPAPNSKILENNTLWCRPCSKLGYQSCPLIHFKCMKNIDVSKIDFSF